MNLQLESIYRQRTTQELQILTMDEHPGNDQGQQTRGRRGVRMHGGRVQRQNIGRGIIQTFRNSLLQSISHIQ